MKHAWLDSDLLQAFKTTTTTKLLLLWVLSRRCFKAASAVPHCRDRLIIRVRPRVNDLLASLRDIMSVSCNVLTRDNKINTADDQTHVESVWVRLATR